jgi:hypothetical protein
MDINKGDRVKLVRLDERDIPRIHVGSVGRVIATRECDTEVLVKWIGRRGYVAHYSMDLEVIPK